MKRADKYNIEQVVDLLDNIGAHYDEWSDCLSKQIFDAQKYNDKIAVEELARIKRNIESRLSDMEDAFVQLDMLRDELNNYLSDNE